ncbi:MAG: polyamine ABC transporter substrate-binding protein [Nocardioidaceae bacterium]
MPAPGRPISRRRLLSRALLASAATPFAAEVLAACGNQLYTSGSLVIAAPTHPVRWPVNHTVGQIPSGQMPRPGSTLRIYNYADYLSPKVIKQFESKYGVNVTLSTFNDTDEALTKIGSRNIPFDIYFPSYDQIGAMVGASLLRPLNHSYIPNVSNLWPQFKDPWYDQGWQYTVPYTVYTTGIAWRDDLINEDISKRSNPYDVFWDPQYAGQIAVIDDWHTAMAMVLLRNGITDVNTGSASDLDLIRTQLLQMQNVTRPKVTVTMYNDLPAGQLSVTQMWSGDVVNAVYYLPKGVSPKVLRYWFPADGTGMVDNDLMVVLAGGPNPVAAHFFINHMLDAAVAKENFFYIGYQPPQRSINPNSIVADGFAPANLSTAAVLPSYFLNGAHLLELQPTIDGQWHQIWQEFKAGA